MCMVPLISTLATHKHCLRVCALLCVSAYVCAARDQPQLPTRSAYVYAHACVRFCACVCARELVHFCQHVSFLGASLCNFVLTSEFHLYGWVCNQGTFISNYSPSTQSCIPCPQLSTVTSATGTFEANQLPIDLVQGNLCAPFRLNKRVDVMLFNPPYVPTPTEEITSSWIARSWAGGEKGREVCA